MYPVKYQMLDLPSYDEYVQVLTSLAATEKQTGINFREEALAVKAICIKLTSYIEVNKSGKIFVLCVGTN